MFNIRDPYYLVSKAVKIFLFSVGAASTAWAQDYIAPPLVKIPAGTFLMGSEGGDPATMPIQPVSVSAFQFAKYPVTVAEFRKFAEDTGFKREFTCNDFIDKEGLRGHYLVKPVDTNSTKVLFILRIYFFTIVLTTTNHHSNAAMQLIGNEKQNWQPCGAVLVTVS